MAAPWAVTGVGEGLEPEAPVVTDGAAPVEVPDAPPAPAPPPALVARVWLCGVETVVWEFALWFPPLREVVAEPPTAALADGEPEPPAAAALDVALTPPAAAGLEDVAPAPPVAGAEDVAATGVGELTAAAVLEGTD